MSDDNSSGGCSCFGCLTIIAFILLICAIGCGLPINDKTLNIDIFPPAIEYK
jgi:hypothetical protein